jgi:hypothetical protein
VELVHVPVVSISVSNLVASVVQLPQPPELVVAFPSQPAPESDAIVHRSFERDAKRDEEVDLFDAVESIDVQISQLLATERGMDEILYPAWALGCRRLVRFRSCANLKPRLHYSDDGGDQ